MALLAPFASAGRFWRGNIHTHSNISDGKLPPDAVVDAYRNAGYDFMQLSEHFLGTFSWRMADTRAFRTNNFTTLIGAELHAPETRVGELWHIVAAGLPLDFPKNLDGETGVRLAARAREAGAFIGIAHPAWSQLTMEDARAIDTAHAVEIYNHGCAVENDRGDGWYLLDQMLSENRRLSAFATDDAHFRAPDHFGGWVHVKAESLDPDALLAGLKSGTYYSSQGPQLHAIGIEGKQIQISCSPVDTITVLCGNSRTQVRNGKAITEAEFDLSRLEKGWLVNWQSPWFRVVAIDHAGKRAWSNPIWWDELR
jgi:hypothetical protein